jgi:RNAse (barnase) inhibitor barstar
MARPKTKSRILDGAALPDAAAVYRALGDAFGALAYFGHNPDALWDAIGDYHGEPIEIVWRHSAQSAARLGPGFEPIVAVLRRAEADGRIKLRVE